MITQAQVNKIFGHISHRALLVWAERQIITWPEEKTDGRGINRLYDFESLLQIGVVEELSALNVPLDVMKFSMDKIREFGPIAGNEEVFLVIKKKKAGYGGWQKGGLVTCNLCRTKEMESNLDNIWGVPGIIIVSLRAVIFRVRRLIKKSSVTF